MNGVLAIFLGLLYVICILFCWSYIRGNNPSKQYKEQLNNLKTENQLHKVKLLKVTCSAPPSNFKHLALLLSAFFYV